MKRLSCALCCLLLLAFAPLWAQPAEGYYSSANGLKDAELKTALHGIIREHTELSYSDLWTAFRKTDCRPDGFVWDMYSSATNYVFGTNQDKGSHSKEGQTYNREHSFPKSWFGGNVTPMYTDLFHLVPTDSYVNQMRNNYPLGDVKTATYTSQGEFSKLGICADTGYSGVVFEPADEYKGDFARIYFYMATCYEDVNKSWYHNAVASDILDPTGYYQFYQPWYVQVLLKWHRADPVSQKEIDRNNAVDSLQHNRNPFVDYPALVDFIWGEYVGNPVDFQALQLYSHDYDGAINGMPSLRSDKLELLEIYDLSGRLVKSFSRGIYIVVYRDKEGNLIYVKECRE